MKWSVDTDVIGVDVAKHHFDVALLLNDYRRYQAHFDNSQAGFQQFLSWLGQYTQQPHICLEATGPYSESLAEFAYRQGLAISVVNPLQIKNFSKVLLTRNKNDRIDAQTIAEYTRRMQPQQWVPRSSQQKVVRELMQLIETYKKQRDQLINQKDTLQSDGVRHETHKGCETLSQTIRGLQRKLREQVQADETLNHSAKLLTSIKGIGEQTAYKLVSLLPDVTQFQNVKQFAAFMGVTPRQHESGVMKGKTCMTHLGHARLKKALYMPALVAYQHNEHLKPFIERLKANGLAPKAIVGAVMRKLAHLIYGVLKSGQAFDPQLACAQ